jgi:hypothetical protein
MTHTHNNNNNNIMYIYIYHIDWFIDWLIDWLVDWLTDWLIWFDLIWFDGQYKHSSLFSRSVASDSRTIHCRFLPSPSSVRTVDKVAEPYSKFYRESEAPMGSLSSYWCPTISAQRISTRSELWTCGMIGRGKRTWGEHSGIVLTFPGTAIYLSVSTRHFGGSQIIEKSFAVLKLGCKLWLSHSSAGVQEALGGAAMAKKVLYLCPRCLMESAVCNSL